MSPPSHTGSAPTLFRGVDLAVFVASFADKLRTAGVTVGLSSEAVCARAIEQCPATDTMAMYWVTRPCLIHDREDIAKFDAVFAAVFDAAGLPIAPWERSEPRGTVKMTGTTLRHSGPADGFAEAAQRMTPTQRPETEAESITEEDPTVETVLPELLPANLVHLGDVPFDELSPDDLDRMGQWLEVAMTKFPRRRGRRWKDRRRGEAVDLRRTLRSALATGGEPIVLHTRVRRDRPRRVVMVADVSGSMESFARAYLHLMRVLVRRREAEVFTFTTSLQRATVPLRADDAQQAIDALCEEVQDRFGGTRIAGSIGELIGSPVWSHAVRGATVIIASDGWDTDAPEDLARHMARLHRLAHRVIWVNPRAAAADFAPVAASMSAALPHVDTLLSGHSLRAMYDVIDAIAAN